MANPDGNTVENKVGQQVSPVLQMVQNYIWFQTSLNLLRDRQLIKMEMCFLQISPTIKYGSMIQKGNLSVFLSPSGRSNGMYFDNNGNLISCADEHEQLWSIDPKGNVTVLVKDYKGKLLNGPNDVFVNSDGKIYFTDPYYQRDYWKRKTPDIRRPKSLLPERRRMIPWRWSTT